VRRKRLTDDGEPAWLRQSANESFHLVLCPYERGPAGGLVVGEFSSLKYLNYVRRLIENDEGKKPWDTP